MPKTRSSQNSEPMADGQDVPRRIAAFVGLGGFIVASMAGIAAENPFNIILTRAVICMIACSVSGWAAGALCVFAVRQDLRAFLAAHPIPDSTQSVESLVDQMRSVGRAAPDGAAPPGSESSHRNS